MSLTNKNYRRAEYLADDIVWYMNKHDVTMEEAIADMDEPQEPHVMDQVRKLVEAQQC